MHESTTQEGAMNQARNQIEYELTEQHLLRVSDAAGQRVECISGQALITVYGMLLDIELRAGQSFVIPNSGLTLIEALDNGRVRIAPPARAQPARRWLHRGWRSLTGWGVPA
jgi:hypothetical protein